MLRTMLMSGVIAVAMTASAAAQNTQNTQGEKMPDHQDTTSTGTSPEGTGSTGFTGGLGGSRIGVSDPKPETVGRSPPQPGPQEYATGADLKGPPSRPPAGRTVE